ncbi:hypothetical protein DRJ48_02025 [Candidatus Woesearchaeota archaeon]|nr:MAG: hypothetical protein DRJ48_02025 [Candidatus Woesearchaeota archaeon]
MVKEKQRARVKCPGRFEELREFIFNDAVPTVLEDEKTGTLRTRVRREDLDDIWMLIEDEVTRFDSRDPYYFCQRTDPKRREPGLDGLSLVPLFPSTYHLDNKIVSEYARAMGCSERVAEILGKMSDQPGKFFSSHLDRDPSELAIPYGDNKHQNLVGYVISANFGIGTACSGGVGGGGVRSDAPFLLEVYQVDQKHHEQHLAGVVGFWAQGGEYGDEMLVAQIQSSRGGSLPKEVQFGVGMLYIAEVAARLMGFSRIVTYSAATHPIFKQHPDSWKQLREIFTCLYDTSARKLNFEPTDGRHGYYVKDLTSNHNCR